MIVSPVFRVSFPPPSTAVVAISSAAAANEFENWGSVDDYAEVEPATLFFVTAAIVTAPLQYTQAPGWQPLVSYLGRYSPYRRESRPAGGIERTMGLFRRTPKGVIYCRLEEGVGDDDKPPQARRLARDER